MDATIHARYSEFRKAWMPAREAYRRAFFYALDGSYMCPTIDRSAARIATWNATHPIVRIGKTPDCFRSMAEIRKWKVDRSSGYLKVVRAAPRKVSPAKQLAEIRRLVLAHGSPELVALVRDLAA